MKVVQVALRFRGLRWLVFIVRGMVGTFDERNDGMKEALISKSTKVTPALPACGWLSI
jgi:hypothetical protein